MTTKCICCGGTGTVHTPEFSSEQAEAIIAHVSSILRVPKSAIMGKRKTAQIAWARHVCFWLTRHFTDSTYDQIASYYKRKHHRTVMDGIKRVEAMREVRPNSWETRDTTKLREHLAKLFAPEPEIAVLEKAS